MDMRVIRDTESDWPNTLPSKEHFEDCISKVSNKIPTAVQCAIAVCFITLVLWYPALCDVTRTTNCMARS